MSAVWAVVTSGIYGRSGCPASPGPNMSDRFRWRPPLVADTVIEPLLQSWPGVRPSGTFGPFVTSACAIIKQRRRLPAANQVAECRGPVPGLQRFGLTDPFLPPVGLAEADPDGLGLSRAGAGAVRAFTQAVATDVVRPHRSMHLDRFVSSISRRDGLGPRTAHYLAMRLGQPAAWPISNRGLRRTLPASTGGWTRQSPDRWRPWRALATAHLLLADGPPPAPAARAVRPGLLGRQLDPVLRRKREAEGEPRVIHTVRGVGCVLREDSEGGR
jgi:hypothetical protein